MMAREMIFHKYYGTGSDYLIYDVNKNDADFDKDMDEGLATANEEEQAKYYGDAQKISWEACPWLFLGNDQIIYSTKSYLSGVYVSPDGAFNFANATLAQ